MMSASLEGSGKKKKKRRRKNLKENGINEWGDEKMKN